MKKRWAAALTVPVVMLTLAASAMADNTAVSISKKATRNVTHRIVYVKATVVCSEDTTSAALQVQVQQTNPAGNTQVATGTVVGIGAFDCSGDEEQVMIPVRRPTGGFAWRTGPAAARNLVFVTNDPSGTFVSTLKGRTITVS